MNIDERLEALTMNLELASRDIQDLRASVQELTASVGDLTATVGSLAAAQQAGYTETVRIFGVIHDSIRGLENVVVDHDRRLDDLENKN